MTPEQLRCYTEEVWIHAQAALGAYHDLAPLLADDITRQRRAVWIVLQGFLVHAGMVSKLLSPPTKDAVSKKRGEALRRHLDVGDGSALLDRAARNAIEHLDERMDNWLRGGYTGFLECVFPDRAALDFLRGNWCVRRVLLADEMVFVTQEASGRADTRLVPLRDELVRVLGECEKRMDAGDPYRYVHPPRGGEESA